MRDWTNPIPRCFGAAIIAATAMLIAAGPARADVVGRLSFSVKDAADEEPLAGAKIILHDTAGVRPDVVLTTDTAGSTTSAPLENRAWQAVTEAEAHESDTRTVTVAADTTTPVEVLLEPLKEKVIKITGQRTLVRQSQTASAEVRNQTTVAKFPSTAGNSQNLGNVLRTIPGGVEDSSNQIHVRDEHSSTSIFVNGYALPGVLQGRAGSFLSPGVVQSMDVMVGGYAPEYGGETAAVMNINLRAGTIKPFATTTLEGGTYATENGILTFGGQAGQPIGTAIAGGETPRRFGYLIDVNGRQTDNALEPPQPDNQTAHNHGVSSTIFGNFSYKPALRDELTFSLNAAPARTRVANRSGLSSAYESVGEGFGYGGFRNANGVRPDATDPSVLGAVTAPLPSQDAFGQSILQKDNNGFGLLQYRHGFNDNLTGVLSLGSTHSGMDFSNTSPVPNLASLPVDSAIEYNPTINRTSDQTELEGALTLAQGAHTYKAGFLLDQQIGDESYELVPGSQLALDELVAIDTRLAPAGTFGSGVDVNGNPIYNIDTHDTTVPTLKVHRSGYYHAGFVQDTWRERKLTVNYGVRLDSYHQAQNLGSTDVDKTALSPRLNMAYAFTPLTVGRLSYNHLFIQPPLAQGAIIGHPIQPETYDHYEADLERQVAPGQAVKLAYYYKNMRNQIDTGLLIPVTQIGVYSAVNFEHGAAHGFEFSYDLTPHGNIGTSAYVAYSNALDKPGGLDNTGAPAPTFNDHDQLNTVSAGLNYTWPSLASVGVDVYHGSGLASSIVFDNKRTPRTNVNVRLATAPKLIGNTAGLELNVENLFDERNVINFLSGFSGTRFEQGRRVLLSLTGGF
jgi:hypothetical protein